MAAPLTTKPQVSGYRFLVRRLEHALVRRDPRMIHDPMRSQRRSVIVGLVLAVLVLAGCGILALLRPQGAVGDSSIILAKDSGALYVRVGDRLHPVLNLASARLIVGESESPTDVKDDKLADYPRGPMLGIPGAPANLDSGGGNPDWSVCDAGSDGEVLTGVIAGDLDGGKARELVGGQGALVSSEGRDHLIYEGRRAEIDLTDATVVRALGIEGESPRPVSAGVLDALEDAPPLSAPQIPDQGQAGPGALAEYTVGTVIRVPQADRDQHYVVLADGVQPVPVTAASVVRAADSQGRADIPEVSPDRISTVSTVSVLPVAEFPATAPEIASPADAPVICVRWHRGEGDPETTLSLWAGRDLPLPEGVTATPMAAADGGGPRTDWFASPGATGWNVQVTDSYGPARRAGALGYVSAVGVRHGIPDAPTAEVLGLGAPVPIPWSIDRLLAPGPALSRSNALVAHDGVSPDRQAVPVVVEDGGAGG